MHDETVHDEAYIAGLPMWAKKKNSLPDIRFFLDELGKPDRNAKIIHVAGTNGKGSVCMYLTQALLDCGKHVGTFVSPHLVSIRERILLDGKPVPAEDFSLAAEEVKKTAARLEQQGFCHPTYFEFLFYTAMLIFEKQAPDYQIMETGLGGRLDATNVLQPVLTVITSISMDHMQYLGNTIREIASEKAGILKNRIPVVYDRNNEEAEKIILEKAAEKCSEAFGVRYDPLNGPSEFDFLPAPYMRENALVAAKAFELLPEALPDKRQDSFVSSVRKVHWAGRMDEICPDIFLDGAHNEDGIRAFAEAAEGLCRIRNKKCVLLFSAVSDKDIPSMAMQLAIHLHPVRIYVAKLESLRAAETQNLSVILKSFFDCPVIKAGSVSEAWITAKNDRQEDEILFCAGSLYLAGEILGKERKDDQLR